MAFHFQLSLTWEERSELVRMATCQGHSPTKLSSPPTTLLLYPRELTASLATPQSEHQVWGQYPDNMRQLTTGAGFVKIGVMCWIIIWSWSFFVTALVTHHPSWSPTQMLTCNSKKSHNEKVHGSWLCYFARISLLTQAATAFEQVFKGTVRPILRRLYTEETTGISLFHQ